MRTLATDPHTGHSRSRNQTWLSVDRTSDRTRARVLRRPWSGAEHAALHVVVLLCSYFQWSCGANARAVLMLAHVLMRKSHILDMTSLRGLSRK
jgi:hypothetical protein